MDTEISSALGSLVPMPISQIFAVLGFYAIAFFSLFVHRSDSLAEIFWPILARVWYVFWPKTGRYSSGNLDTFDICAIFFLQTIFFLDNGWIGSIVEYGL